MPTNVFPLRPDLLPAATRHVEVAGKVWPVSITEEDHGWLATHQATGCWGYGDTVEAAMADCQDMMDAIASAWAPMLPLPVTVEAT